MKAAPSVPGEAPGRALGWLLLAALPPLALTLAPIRSDDFWFHLATGRWIATMRSIPHVDVFSFTARGQPWVLHEWLWELGVWGIWQSLGPLGIVALRIAGSWCALGGAWAAARVSGAPARATALAVALLSLAAARRFTDRPQVLTAAAFGVLLALLELHRRGQRRPWRWAVLPLFVVWANCHAGVLYGVILLAYEAVWRAGERRWKEAAELGCGVLAALAVGLWCTPVGLDGLLYPLRIVGANSGLDIEEYRPLWAFLNQLSFWPAIVAMVVSLSAAVVGLRRDPRSAVRTLALIAAALWHVRGVDLAALSAVPLVATAMARKDPDLEVRRFAMGLGAVWSLVALWLGTDPARRPRLGVDLGSTPAGAVAFLNQLGVSGLGYNSYSFGGYLLYAAPSRQVFIDGRVDPYLELLSRLHAGLDPFTVWPMTYSVNTYSEDGLPVIRQHVPLLWFDDVSQVEASGYPALELHCLLPEGPFFTEGALPEQCLAEAERLGSGSAPGWRAELLLSTALLRAHRSEDAEVALARAATTSGAPSREILEEMRAMALALAAPAAERAALLSAVAARWQDPVAATLSSLATGDCSGLQPFFRQFFEQSNWLAGPRSPISALLVSACSGR